MIVDNFGLAVVFMKHLSPTKEYNFYFIRITLLLHILMQTKHDFDQNR